MITFDQENEIFYLNTKSTTYAMGVNGEKLFHRYWGKRLVNPLGKTDLSDYEKRNFPALDLDGGNSDIVPFEYSTYGNADMRIPSVEFTFTDGSRVSNLTYKGYEITDGKPALEGLPATYCEEGDKVQTLVIRLEDTYQNVDVLLSYSVFEDLDAITRSTKIVNRGERLLLDSAMSATVDFYGSPELEILHLDGAWSRERHITRQPIVPGNQSINSRYGCSSHFHNPFIALCDKNATENHGNVYGFNLVYSGNFTAGAEQNSYNSVRAYIGINPTNFQFVLEKGDSFQTPEAVLVYSAKGLGEMSRIYHKLYRTRLCRGKYRDTERFVLINNWEATYFDFDEDKIVAIAEKAATLLTFLKDTDGGVGVNLDPANFVMVTGQDPVQAVEMLGDYIVHTHAKDGVMLKQTDPEIIYDCFAKGGIEALNVSDYFIETPLGEGKVNFPEYIKALKNAGYNGYLTIERETGENPIPDIKAARDMVRSIIV